MATELKARTLDLESLVLLSGNHEPDSKFCVMEAVAYVAGERWSDSPKCASPVISAFLRNWNDQLSDEDRQMLKPLIPRLVGTAASKEVESRRAWMAVDWLARVQAPAWLRLANMIELAESLEGTDELVGAASAEAAKPKLTAAWTAALDAAGDAAGDAAWTAAGYAAWTAAGDAARTAAAEAARTAARAAALDAPGYAAWTAALAAAGYAAWTAAGDAARTAAAEAAWTAALAAALDAAGYAAWAAARTAARDALRPTVVTLQKSALELVGRMIKVQA